MLKRMMESLCKYCEELVSDQSAMARLRGFSADLFIGDVVTPCSWAVSDLLRCAEGLR